jgi:hypothetical protein
MLRISINTISLTFLLGYVTAGLPSRAAAPQFEATVRPVPQEVRAKMQGTSWHSGCPIGLDDLAYLRLTYWGFDGSPHPGILVVHRKLASETVEIFRELFKTRFAIGGMQPYEDFAVGKYAENDDTVGFYCRPDQGDPTRLGLHSYGYAIDINPVQNPYLDAKEGWWPVGSEANSDRNREAPGLITTRSRAFEVFTLHGWVWGGLFRGNPDYMHFEKATIGAHPDPTDAPYLVTGLAYQKR